MVYDYKNARWQSDAHAWDRYLKMYQTFTSDWGKAHIRMRMTEIQKRWPQYLKIDEIP